MEALDLEGQNVSYIHLLVRYLDQTMKAFAASNSVRCKWRENSSICPDLAVLQLPGIAINLRVSSSGSSLWQGV